MYEGQTGTLKIPPVHIELKEGGKPYVTRPFPVPKAYEQLTKDECRHFEEAGIWEHTLDTEWASPSFIVPERWKKNFPRSISSYGLSERIR